MRALYNCAARFCTTAKHLQRQASAIKKFLSWNGFPKHVANAFLRQYELAQEKRHSSTDTSSKSKHDPDVKTIWIQVPHASNAGEAIMKRLISKLKRC